MLVRVKKNIQKKKTRKRLRIRKSISGTLDRPRLVVYKSCKHFYAQIINDTEGITLCQASTADKTFKKNEEAILNSKHFVNSKNAVKVASLLVDRAKEKGIIKAVFDRNLYLYHGVIKEFLMACRSAGLVI